MRETDQKNKLASVSMLMKNDLNGCDSPSSRYYVFDHGVRIECEDGNRCLWCSLTEEEKEIEKEKLTIEKEGYRQKILEKRVSMLNSLRVEGLDAHNRSIDLVVSTFTDIFNSDPKELNSVETYPCYGQKHALLVNHRGQTDKVGTPIDVSLDTSSYSASPSCKDLLISLTGKESGIKYSIELRFHMERAVLLGGRISEVMEANEFYQEPQPIRREGNSFILAASDYTPLRSFVESLELMTFRVFAEDKDGDREYVCIDPQEGVSIWPGDNIVSLMMSLRNDMSTCLEPSMYTLRGKLLEGGAAISFLRGNCQISIHRLHAYLIAFKGMSNSTSHSSRVDSYELMSNLQELFSDPDYPSNPESVAPLLEEIDEDEEYFEDTPPEFLDAIPPTYILQVNDEMEDE